MNHTPLLAALALGCAQSVASNPEASPAPDPVAAPAASEAPLADVAEHMRAHYAQLTAARDAVIDGELDDARDAMVWLGHHAAHPSLPEATGHLVSEMQGAARVGAIARDAHVGAAAVATTAGLCGECHALSGVALRFDAAPMPEPGWQVGQHMARHQWAVDRMWEGLIGPSEALWEQGVEALQEEPLEDGALHGGVEMSAEEAALAAWLHEMAALGQPTESPIARAALYGHVLSSCAGCHATIGGAD